MMKFLRLQGLAVFGILAILIGGFFYLFLDGIIKSRIESAGSEILGAQIEIASLSTSLPAQSVNIKRLAVANPDNRMENTIEVGALEFNVDAGKGLRKKVVIDDMSVEEVRFNQPRETEAKAFKSAMDKKEVVEPSQGEQAKGRKVGVIPSQDDFKIKSPEEILKSEKLRTLEEAKTARKELEELKSKWEGKLKNELKPQALENTKKRIADLQAKSKNLSGPGDIQAVAQELQSVKKEIQGHLDRIKNLKSEFQEDVRRAKKIVADLKNAPEQDFQRLKNKYSLDIKGGSNILGTLLGGEIKKKLDKFWVYYEKISPYLNKGAEKKTPEEEDKYVRGKGIFVQFEEAEPFPDFLVRHAKLSMNLLDTRVAGELKDFSDNQRIYGKPAVMNFESGKSDTFDQFGLQVKLDRTQALSNDSLQADIRSLKLDNFKPDETVEIQKGFADIQSSLNIKNERELAGFIQVSLNRLALQMPQKEGDEMFNTIAQTLSSMNRLDIKITLKGTLDNYSLDIESGLDKIVSQAVRKALSGKVREFEGSLKKSILSATGGPLKKVDGSLSEFIGSGKSINANESSWNDLLSQATKEAVPGADSIAPGVDTKKIPLPEGFKLPF